jgi:hypothetical protein
VIRYFNDLAGIPKIEIQRPTNDVPASRIAVIAIFSPIVGVQHPKSLVGPFNPCRIPLFVPGMARTIVEGFYRSIRCESNSASQKIAFDGCPISVGCRVHPIDPAKLDPVPVPYQKYSAQAEGERSVEGYAVFMLDLPRLRRSKKLIATAEQEVVLFVGVNVFYMRNKNRLELIAERRSRIPLLKGIANSLLQTSKR